MVQWLMGLVQKIESHLLRNARRRARPIVVRIYDHLQRRFSDPRIRWDDYRFRALMPSDTVALEVYNHLFLGRVSERFNLDVRLDQTNWIWIS
jgi:hypothetical protein